ncbi:MAG: glycosyltransferase family 2 protein [Candidatus Magasanikbacteria bacterium]|nr:glycosyltransferase family 2 protein [Candidatus Magasanikbacteria bacterium]
MKLSIQLVTWNGAAYIPYLFDSLRKQNFFDWKLSILDNASQDNTVERIKHELSSVSIPFEFIENKVNEGFAGGHNRLFKKNCSEYVLLLNQDMYLGPDCLQRMLAYLETHAEISAVSPRLMRWDFRLLENADSKAGIDQELLKRSFTDQIDALGLKIFRSRRVVEQYTRQNWSEIRHMFVGNNVLVFGLSGAFPLYRCSDLKESLYANGSLFDESYHAYKEDVDLAYRLLSAGKSSLVLLDIFAYHDRSGAGPREMEDMEAAKNKRLQSEWVRYHSYKNHLMTLYKNEYGFNFLLDFFWILWYELKKFFWLLIFDRKVLKGFSEIFRERGALQEKRKYIKAKRRLSWRNLRPWWL